MTREEIAAERERLENAVADAFIALQQTPTYQTWQAAEMELGDHRVLYGMDLTREPIGLLPAADFCADDAGYPLPDEFEDDGRCDFTVNREGIAE